MAQADSLYRHRWRLRVLQSAAFLTAISFMDVRDLWYKIKWVGPFDSFAFKAGSEGTLHSTPLTISVSVPSANSSSQLSSGWPSYLSRCKSLTPFLAPDSTFFLHTMATNCQMNDGSNISQLVLTSNVRSDSIAWGACNLLYSHRRPKICQQSIVSHFLYRYRLNGIDIPVEWLVPVQSAAEEELLQLLDVISTTYPRYKMVCTGGFAYNTPGEYIPTIYGCASANEFRVEFAGLYATHLHELLFDKAWLSTIEVLSFIGYNFVIRQNSISMARMEEINISSSTFVTSLKITETTSNNYVSFGPLYVLMIAIDTVLLLAQMYTGTELVTLWIIPALKKKLAITPTIDDQTSTRKIFSSKDFAFLTASLFRNRSVIILTIVSQVLSWGIIIPNSIVWTWSLSYMAKIQAFLSTLRLWTLIMISINFLWDAVVLCFEKQAFWIARATFITPLGIVLVAAIVVFCRKDTIMAISETKFALEHQRVNDFESFRGFIAHGNTFNEALDDSFNTRLEMLRVLYLPLVNIIGCSVLAVFPWLMIKMAIYQICDLRKVSQWFARFKRKLIRRFRCSKDKQQLSTDRQRAMQSPSLPSIQSMTFNHSNMVVITRDYERLPLEKLLQIPMRARSLVRSTWKMEDIINGEVWLKPSIQLEFGVFQQDRLVVARRGFGSIFQTTVTLPEQVATPEMNNTHAAWIMESVQSMSLSRSTTRRTSSSTYPRASVIPETTIMMVKEAHNSKR